MNNRYGSNFRYTPNQYQRPPEMAPNNCPPSQGGYDISADNEMAKMSLGQTKQIFASRPLTDPETPEANLFALNNTKEFELVSAAMPSAGERLWLVTVNAIEVLRISGEAPLPRLSQESLISRNGPRYSTLQAKIKWMDGSASSNIKVIDIAGGSTFQIFGRNIQIYILAPTDSILIENGNANPSLSVADLKDGIVLDALISARIAPTLGKGNLDWQKFTWLQGVGANETEFVEIPPGARKIQIFNATIGVATVEMYFWMSNSSSGHCVGIIDFSGDKTEMVNIPCGATYISTGATQGVDRCFSFVFAIDP